MKKDKSVLRVKNSKMKKRVTTITENGKRAVVVGNLKGLISTEVDR